METRIQWIDYAKVIGIYFVILAHLPSGIIGFSIYSFHMPLFFIISGILFNPQSKIGKSFHRLLLPVIIYTLIGLIFMHCINHTMHNMKDLLPYVTLNHKQMNYFFVPLWFVVVLFFHRIVTIFLLNNIRCHKYIIIIISIITSIISIIIKKNDIQIGAFDFDTFLFSYIFFQLGYVFKNNIINIIQKSIKKMEILYIITFPLWIYLVIQNETVNIFRLEYGNSILLFLINISYGTILTFRIAYIISQKQFLPNNLVRIISNGTLCILALHLLFVNSYITYIMPILFNLPPLLLLFLHIIVAGAILILFVPIILLLKRYFPLLS